jgi:molybdopterin synthase catalytic subunit
MRRRWALTGVAAAHRVGTVAVGEASVVIVASSAHRRAALEARIFTRRVGAKESSLSHLDL